MIEKIIEFSAKNKYIVILLALAAIVAAVYCIQNIPLDAIPDLSDTQVIIYSRWDRSPDIIEDQVTYPIVTAMLGAPKVKAIRGYSDFGFSYVYVIFQDGTDIYWARSRTLEYLSKIHAQAARGRQDGNRARRDVASAGSINTPSSTRPGKTTWPSCAASRTGTCATGSRAFRASPKSPPIGGFQKQYQVNVDPDCASAAYKIPLMKVVEAIRDGNNDVGGRLVEFTGTEYMVRGAGLRQIRRGHREHRHQAMT